MKHEGRVDAVEDRAIDHDRLPADGLLRRRADHQHLPPQAGEGPPEGGARACGRRADQVVAARVPDPWEGVVFGEEGDARAAASPPLSGHEGGPEPRDAAPHGEPLRPQEADETGGRLDLLQAQLGAEVQGTAQRMDRRRETPEMLLDAGSKRWAGAIRKPNPVAAVTGGRWSFLYPRGFPRGRRRGGAASPSDRPGSSGRATH